MSRENFNQDNSLTNKIEVQNSWPFDALGTDKIFSLLDIPDLMKISFTCRFFRKNAQEVLLRKLEREYGFVRHLYPKTLLPHLPKIIEEFYNALNNPICSIGVTDSHLPFFCRNPVANNYPALAICRRVKDGSLCLMGSFALPSKSGLNFNNGSINVYQFMAGVDANGYVYVKRITNDMTKSIERIPKQIPFRGQIIEPSFDTYYSNVERVIQALFINIVSGKSLSFESLLRGLPWGSEDWVEARVIDCTLRFLEEEKLRLARKESGCTIA